MAQKVVYQLIDDLDETVLADGDGETVTFGLDGVDYEIDLSTQHAGELRDALGVYVQAARPRTSRSARASGGTASASGSSGARGPVVKRDLESVRTWARENGFTVSTRGRIPAAVSEAYHAANG